MSFDFDALDALEEAENKIAEQTVESWGENSPRVARESLEDRIAHTGSLCLTGCEWRKKTGRVRLYGWFQEIAAKKTAQKALEARIAAKLNDRNSLASKGRDSSLFFSTMSEEELAKQEEELAREKAEIEELKERVKAKMSDKKAKEEAERIAKEEEEIESKKEKEELADEAKAQEARNVIKTDEAAKELPSSTSMNHSQRCVSQQEPEEEALPGEEKLPEAKLKAEKEAKQREEEARLKDEEEARLRAEEQARISTEETRPSAATRLHEGLARDVEPSRRCRGLMCFQSMLGRRSSS